MWSLVADNLIKVLFFQFLFSSLPFFRFFSISFFGGVLLPEKHTVPIILIFIFLSSLSNYIFVNRLLS